jgi:hypothetical protein
MSSPTARRVPARSSWADSLPRPSNERGRAQTHQSASEAVARPLRFSIRESSEHPHRLLVCRDGARVRPAKRRALAPRPRRASWQCSTSARRVTNAGVVWPRPGVRSRLRRGMRRENSPQRAARSHASLDGASFRERALSDAPLGVSELGGIRATVDGAQGPPGVVVRPARAGRAPGRPSRRRGRCSGAGRAGRRGWGDRGARRYPDRRRARRVRGDPA